MTVTTTIAYFPGQLFTGLTVTAIVYPDSAGDAAGTSLTFTENTNRKGYYTATSNALTAGINRIDTNLGDTMKCTIPPVTATVVVAPSGVSDGGLDLNAVPDATGTVTLGTLLAALESFMAGKSVVVNNGDGTNTVTFYKADGVTVSQVITFNSTTGARAATGSIS